MGGESRYWSSGPIRVFFFACLLYEHGVYTRDTCSKSKFYLRTMRGKVVSRSTGLRGGHEHPKRISNAHVRFDHLSLSLPPPSRPLVAYVVHRLKPNSTVLKGFFFLFYTLQTYRTRDEINDSAPHLRFPRVRVCVCR